MIYDAVKRFIDIIGALIGLILLSPLFLITMIAIKLDSRGPIFADTPGRVGKDGELFRMYKFRSMVVGAHELLKSNPELYKKYKENSYKLEINEDPRITKVGRVIRKYSIDELPQFINVLKGDMSLVGHRAYYAFELEEQQKKYPRSREFVKIILASKPGVTGIWQVSGRSNISFDKRVEMDAHYAQRRSILYDLYIIVMTIPAVITARGAV